MQNTLNDETTRRFQTYEYDQNAVRVPQEAPREIPQYIPEYAPEEAVRPEKVYEPRHRISLLFLLAFVLGTVVLCSIISMYAEMTQLAMKSNKLKSEIASMEKQQSGLKLELDRQMTWVELEDYAVNTLGMMKVTGSNVTYLEHETAEVFELAAPTETENKVIVRIRQAVEDCAETVWNFIN